MSKRAEQATAVVLTLMATLLHLLRVRHAGALWRDEAGAAQLAALPSWREIYLSFPHEAFPLLFPATLRGWTGLFGDSDLAYRLLGLLVGLVILAALWWNARIAGALPLASIVLIQFHPAFPLYGDSVRGYGLGTLAILLTFGAFARLVELPDRRRVLFALVAAVASVHLLMHNAALLAGIGGAAAVVGVVRRRWRVTVAALGIGVVAALTLLPYAGPLASAREWRVLLVQKVTPQEVVAKLGEVTGITFPWMAWVWVGAVVVAAGIWWVKDLRDVRDLKDVKDGRDLKDDSRLFRLVVIPAALGGEMAFLIAVGYSPRIWYLLPVLALVASALDGLLGAMGSVPARVARIGAAALLAAALYATALHMARLRMTNVDEVARALEQSVGPRDLVLVNEWYNGISFHRYYRGEARWMTVPALSDHRMHRFDLIKTKMQSGDPLLEVRRAIRRTLRNRRRVWFVGRLDVPADGTPPLWLPPAPGGPWKWLDGPYTLAWTQQVSVLLETHAARKRKIMIPAGGHVSGMEFLWIWSYEGWEPPSSPRPPRATARPGSRALPSPAARGTPPRTATGPGRRAG